MISQAGTVELTFAERAYRRYDEGSLCHQLERLGQLAWVAYDRARTERQRRSLGLSAEEFAADQRLPKDERRRRYDADLGAMEARGESPGGSVRVQSRGVLRWQVRIEPGTLERLTEAQFLSELDTALGTLFADREMQATIIKARYYDLGIPRAWRDWLRDPGRDLRDRV